MLRSGISNNQLYWRRPTICRERRETNDTILEGTTVKIKWKHMPRSHCIYHIVNSLMLNVVFWHYELCESIWHQRNVRFNLFLSYLILNRNAHMPYSNNVDPDQVSDMDLHYLHRISWRQTIRTCKLDTNEVYFKVLQPPRSYIESK